MSLTDAKDILVYIETIEGEPTVNALEVLGKAYELAKANDEKVFAVLIGKDTQAADSVAKAGADRVLLIDCDDDCPMEKRAILLNAVVKEQKPALVLMACTQMGKDLSAKLAYEFGTVAATEILNLRKEEDYVFTCPLYGGTVWHDVVIDGYPKIATARTGVFKKCESETAGEISSVSLDTSMTLRTRHIDSVREASEHVNLEEAEFVVGGGRGMGTKDRYALVHDLANLLGGVVGATRPAIEEGWISRQHQVGQSGKIVSPKLYIACGISGATQHLTGVMGADFIVAINKDEEASIFDVADVGIVGDVAEVLPLLIEEFKKIKNAS